MGLLNRMRSTPVRETTVEIVSQATPIAEIVGRSKVTVSGTITRIKAIPQSGMPSLVVTIDDGTDTTTAIWSGRRAIGGVTLGRRIEITGTAVGSARGFEFYNPVYTLQE